MVKKTLVEELIRDGEALLRELDRQGFPVESMFWIDLPEQDYWRLVIASPLVGVQGSTAAYRRLQEILPNLDLAGLALEDIALLQPDSPQLRSLLSMAEGGSRLAVGAAWVVFEEAVVYRWVGASLRGELSCDLSSEQLTRAWDAERKRCGLPALLIDVDARRVTLRFHPQHGPLSGIENMKQQFHISLRRPDAFPQCQVDWLV